jgi:hypothetical protein
MIRQHHRIKTAVALSAIAAALLVAGCGGSSSGTAAGGNTVRAAYASPTGSGYQIAIKVTGSAAGHPINVSGSGAFDQAAHAGQLAMNVSQPSLGGKNLQIKAVILGKEFYLGLPASLAGNVPGGKPWLELSLSEIGKAVGFQGLPSLAENPAGNPAEFTQLLRSASPGGVENIGDDTIDGLTTTGVRATIDLSKVANTLPVPERPSASSAIASIEKLTGLRYLPTEAWVDSSNHVRRIILSETGRIDGQPFSEKVQLDFVKYGLEPMPAAPPASEVTNITSQLGAL